MYYKDFKGIKISALGFGAMRLPTLEGGAIDVETADAMVARARGAGINYFDTAYGYHDGKSEAFLGKSLARFPRGSWLIADKFPGYLKRDSWDPAEIFEEQLERCGVGHFDFYLLHNVYESNFKTYTDPRWGIVDYLDAQRRAGRIRHLGFSIHANLETFLEFLGLCGGRLEFCQIQLNALDWTLQDGKIKWEALKERGIPVWVMEPVRGGGLATFGDERDAALRAARPGASVASWAMRWLQGLDGLGVILSGMTTPDQLEDNLKTFSAPEPLTEAQKGLYEATVASLAEMIPCTGCRYCVPECQAGLEIPNLIKLCNDCRVAPSMIAKLAVYAMKPSRRPSACVSCGRCVEVCPQGIDVPKALADLTAVLQQMPEVFRPPREEDED